GQVADDRADRAAAAAAGRKRKPWRAGAAYLERDLACQLEHLPVEEEEAGEAQLGDQRQLLAQALACASPLAGRIPLSKRPLADPAQVLVGGLGSVGEVGVAVAELLGQVERQPGGELGGAPDGVAVVGEPLLGSVRRHENELVVSTPFGLAAVERGARADRDERVLQPRAPGMVGVDVAGGDGGDAEVAGE